MCVVISCETGGNLVPPNLKSIVESRDPRQPLRQDVVAKSIAIRLAEKLNAHTVIHQASPELINVGKSLQNQRLLSKPFRPYREQLINEIYQPYHDHLTEVLGRELIRSAFVVHVSVESHSLRNKKGVIRRGDVGLAYDPHDDDQTDLVLDWIDQMWDYAPMLKPRRNYPKRGTTESIVTLMKDRINDSGYYGLSLSVNRAWAARSGTLPEEAIDGMAVSLSNLLDQSAEVSSLEVSDVEASGIDEAA